MKLIRTAAGLAALSVLGGAIFWRFSEKKAVARELTEGQARRKSASPSVVTVVAGPATLSESLTVVGSLEASAVSRIASRSTARIGQISVREGARVRAGEPLVKLDPAELRAALLQQEAAAAEARARLAQARATEGAAQTAVNSGVESQRAALDGAVSDLAQARRTAEAQVNTGKAQVADASAKVASAKFSVANARADLGAAKANLENAVAQRDRNESLLAKGFVSEQSVDNFRTQVKVQQGAVASAEGKLSAAQAAQASAQAQLASVASQAALANRKAEADIASFQSKKAQAEAALRLARANRSQPQAYRENLAALAQSVRAAEALRDQAKGRLKETVLLSPRDGVVTQRLLDEGTVATAGQTVLTVSALDPIFVVASVPVEQSRRISVGATAKIALDGRDARPLSGSVSELNPSADPASRQFVARIRLSNPDFTLRPGAFARVTLNSGGGAVAVAVPTDAVKSGKKGDTVTVIGADGASETRPVTLGRKVGGLVEIVSGVAAGEKVVTLSYTPVKDGQKVREGGENKSGSKK